MASDTKEKIANLISTLRSTVKHHNSVGMDMINAQDGAIYEMDLITITVLNRSISLLDGFCDLLKKRNFIAAAPLLRLQLDNLLRYRAAWLVNDPRDLVTKMLQGDKVKDLVDRTGHKMTDSYLIKDIAIQHPKLQSIYEHTSGYIHLSDKHFFSTMGKPDENGIFNMKISSSDEGIIPDEIYIEALMAFMEVTGILFQYLSGWVSTKKQEKE